MKITIEDKEIIFSYNHESITLKIGEDLTDYQIARLVKFLIGFLTFSLSWDDSPERMGR
jgi:hypothetical protein